MAKQPETKVKFSIFNKEFNEGMREMGQQSATLRKEFKLQEAQLQENGSETDKLKNKINYLSQEQEIATKRIQATADQLAKAKSTYGENSKEVGSLTNKLLDLQIKEQKLLNDISRTNKQLNEQGKEMLDTSEDANKLSDSLKNLGDKSKDVANNVSGVAAVGVGVVGASVTRMASEFDSANKKLQRTTQLTQQEIEELGDVAEDVWKNGFGDSLDNVTDTVGQVRRTLGKLNKDELRDTSKIALQLEKDWGDGVNEQLRAAKALMDRFGLSSSEAFDYIVRGYQNNLNYSDDFLDTISEYSTQFDEAGFSVDEMFNLLAQGEENGSWNLDQLADAVKEFRIEAMQASDRTNEGFKKIGLNAEEMSNKFAKGGDSAKEAFDLTISKLKEIDDPLLRTQAGVEIFGTKFEDVGADVLLALDPTVKKLGDIKGASNEVAASAEEDFGQRFQSTMRAASESVKPLGDILLDVADRILPKIDEYIDRFSTWFEELDPKTQEAIIGIGLFIAALGPLLMILTPIVNLLLKLGGFFSGIPAMAAIAAAAFTPIKTKLEELRDKTIQKVIEGFVFMTAAYTIGKNKMKEIATNFVSEQVAKYEDFKQKVKQKIFETVVGIVLELTQMKDKADTKIQELVNSGVSKFDELKSKAKSKFNEVKENILSPIEEAKDKISEKIEQIKGFFSNLKLNIPTPSLPKMPKFSLSTGSKTVFGKTITYPNGLDISWHKTGGVFTDPVIAGNAGFGDVEEGIVPFEGSHAMKIAKLIASAQNKLAGVSSDLTSRTINNVVQVNVSPSSIYLDKRAVGKVIWEPVKDEIEMHESRNMRGDGLME